MTSAGRIFPARLAAALLAAAGGVLAESLGSAQNTPLTTAPVRLRIEKIAQTDWLAKVGVFDECMIALPLLQCVSHGW